MMSQETKISLTFCLWFYSQTSRVRRADSVGQSWFALLLTGYVDGPEPLEELNVVFHLRHLGLQLLSVGLLGHGLGDQREALVLVVQLVPGPPQTLDTDTRTSSAG